MLINNFSDGSREKSLRFTSNGMRSLTIDVPKGAIVKEAVIELEAQELPDSSVIRLGLVKNCSLDDFNSLEERLETSSWGKNTVRQGWGTSERTTFLVGETGKYRVIPIDPSSMIGAHPSYYRREFDAVIIPNGPLHVDITNLINSRIPIITMNPTVAEKIGLCAEESLHAAISKLHLSDRLHYVCEQFREENLRIGGRETEPFDQILVNAIKPSDESAKGIVDTGFTSQSIVVMSMDRKYVYLGFTRVDQLLGENILYTLFHRTIQWCSIGGYITNIGIDVCGLPGGFKKLGRLTDILDTPDFTDKLNDFIESSKPNEEGNYPVEIALYSDSPGILIAGNVRVDCVFLTTIARFGGGERDVELKFDSVQERKNAYVEIPTVADIKSATLRIEGDLSRERLAVSSLDEQDIYGVTGSTQYMVAQQVKVENILTVSRIGLHLSRPEGDVELDAEVREDHRNLPVQEVLAVSALKGNDIKKKYTWVDLEFDNLVLKPGVKYWILLKVKKGKVHWHADKKCPKGGLLKFTKDGGKNWSEHGMDALFKVYYKMESYEASPALSLQSGADHIWGYSGEFREVTVISDFSQSLTDYMALHAREVRGTDVIRIPLTFSAQSIGTLKLTDLEIKCELPTLDMKEKMETVTVGKQLSSILELIAKVNVKVAALMEMLPKEVLENLEMEELI
jgi:hypothetical protein